MAIVVKGKIRLCQTSLADWNPERVNGVLFYERYLEYLRLFSSKIPQVNFEKSFAQPVFNDENSCIDWFCAPMEDSPISLAENPDPHAEAEKSRIISSIKNAAKSLSDNDRKYIDSILKTLESDKVDTITYYSNGQIVFGIWGMTMKKGKVINDVIIDNIKDHRVHHVKYKVHGKGTLTFTEIVRKHGHILGGDSDIPSFTPAIGYLIKGWLPDSPSGVKVDKALEFTIVFEKDPNYIVNPEIEEPPIIDTPDDEDPPSPEEPKQDPDPNYYTVKFISDERGVIHGQSEYRKKEGDRVFQAEVPHVEPKDGYRFVGWSMNPIDYVVNSDTTFEAQFEPIEKPDDDNIEHGGPFGWLSNLLNWLLAGLLLLLIGLPLWYLLGNHNINFCGNDCGCDGEEETVNIDPIDPNDLPVNPIQSVCDATTCQGSNNSESHLFDMGQQSGTFVFEYGTGNALADKIVIYDGKSRNDKMIFNYYGATGDCALEEQAVLSFSNRYILIDIIPDYDPNTCWIIKPNCPQ